MTTILHATLVMERRYNASPKRVFDAWENVEARKRWSAPAPDIAIEYERSEFREGGRDISHCVENGKRAHVAEVTYLDIRQDQSIVVAEAVSLHGKKLSTALISVELMPHGAGTELLLTMQIAAFDAEMENGYQFGWSAALDNLAKEFA
ncbi:MAG: hypothetical protein DCF16_16570 [Alphaproteobacteria bacterium]|nr:MAG: hypothetical protein DCF16_16570 [Alphaproteobacteria bacterium]